LHHCGRLVLVSLAAAALFNLLVDPLGAYPAVHLKNFEPQRHAHFSRVARGELARRGPWDLVILGTSRPKAGLPARHPAYGSNRVCNLAVDAARMSEAAAMVEYVARRQPVRHFVLFLDFAMFRSSTFYMYDFAESRFNPRVSLFEYHCKNLIGSGAFDRSWQATSRRLLGRELRPGQTNGFYAHRLRPNTAQRELFGRELRSVAFAYSAMRPAQEQLDHFRRVLRFCRAQRIQLTLVMNPVHALDLELWRAGGNWEGLENWKRGIVALVNQEGLTDSVPVWDFSGYSTFTTEPLPPPADTKQRMQFYYESSHYTPALGGIVLERILGQVTNDLGRTISTASIEEHLQSIRKDREAYARTHAEEVQWVSTIVKQVLAARKRSQKPAEEPETTL
jgi:hypothetical protein